MDCINILVRLMLQGQECIRGLRYLDDRHKTVVLHYLTKLDALTSAINTFLKFTYSPRMRYRFFNSQKIVIDPVYAGYGPLPSPCTARTCPRLLKIFHVFPETIDC